MTARPTRQHEDAMSTHTPTGRDDFLNRAYDPFLRPDPIDRFAPLAMVAAQLEHMAEGGRKYKSAAYVEGLEAALTVVRTIQAGAR